MSPKGPPSIFSSFATEWILKISKGPPFYIFWHYEIAQFSHFSSDISFSQYITTNNSIRIFNTVHIFDVISEVKRYIRTFAIISELYLILLLEEKVQKQELSFVQHASIQTSEAFSERLSLSKFFVSFSEKNVLSIF